MFEAKRSIRCVRLRRCEFLRVSVYPCFWPFWNITMREQATCPKLKFSRSDRFIRELRRRVDAHFERTGLPKRDCPQMYFKTAVILTWFVAAYLLLLFVATSWWIAVPLAAVMGLAVAAVGFNVQHD